MASPHEIVQGEDTEINAQIIVKDTQEALVLTDFVGATGYFPQEDSEDPLTIVGTLVSEDLGTVKMVLAEADTALLKAGERQDFEVKVVYDTDKTLIAQYKEALTVYERQFPE